jgi:hypothetical protein
MPVVDISVLVDRLPEIVLLAVLPAADPDEHLVHVVSTSGQRAYFFCLTPALTAAVKVAAQHHARRRAAARHGFERGSFVPVAPLIHLTNGQLSR